MTSWHNWAHHVNVDMESKVSSITVENARNNEPTYEELKNEVLKKDLELYKKDLELYKKDLELYKSLFTTHKNSCVFNLSIKKKNGKNVWVDRVNDDYSYIESLDRDKEVNEWLEPIKPSR